MTTPDFGTDGFEGFEEDEAEFKNPPWGEFCGSVPPKNCWLGWTNWFPDEPPDWFWEEFCFILTGYFYLSFAEKGGTTFWGYFWVFWLFPEERLKSPPVDYFPWLLEGNIALYKYI